MEPPAESGRLARRGVDARTTLWIVGAHGGAGETTWAGLVQGAAASGRAWPVSEAVRPRVALVARSDMRGLLAAKSAVIEWASGTVPVDLVGLVLGADAPGKAPKALRDEARRIGGGAPRLWLVDWVEEWRMAPGSTQGLPKNVRSAAADLSALSHEPPMAHSHPQTR